MGGKFEGDAGCADTTLIMAACVKWPHAFLGFRPRGIKLETTARSSERPAGGGRLTGLGMILWFPGGRRRPADIRECPSLFIMDSPEKCESCPIGPLLEMAATVCRFILTWITEQWGDFFRSYAAGLSWRVWNYWVASRAGQAPPRLGVVWGYGILYRATSEYTCFCPSVWGLPIGGTTGA